MAPSKLRSSIVALALVCACASKTPPEAQPTAADQPAADKPAADQAPEGPVPLPDAPDAALGARIQTAVDAAIQQGRITGAVVMVAKDGKLVHRSASGLADREKKVPMREDTLFRYASVTKPWVAVTALALIQSGVLSLEDPVTKYLPWFQPQLASGAKPDLTVRMLLTHTSGLGYRFNEFPAGAYHAADISDGCDAPGRTAADNLGRLAKLQLRVEPGKFFLYSLSLDVLGELMAVAAKKPLPELVAERITAPLGLHDTGFTVVDRARLATPYADGDGAPILMTDGIKVPLKPLAPMLSITFAPSRQLDPKSYPSGGGGMTGSARDLLVFLEALRRGGAPVLSTELTSGLFEDQLRGANPQWIGTPGMRFSFAGAILADQAAAGTPTSCGTLEWSGAYGHVWFIDRAAGITAVILTNTAFEGMAGQLPRDIKAAIYPVAGAPCKAP